MFGLAEGNPLNTNAYATNVWEAALYGTTQDPMVGTVVGGTIVFGGGVALYGSDGKILGAVGISGDTSCAGKN